MVKFIAKPAEGGIVAALEALQPTNPFVTAAYFESRRRLGYSAWVTGLCHSGNELADGCGAFLKRGMLNRTLEVPSLPNFGIDSVFWRGLDEFCRCHGVTRLVLGTFASSEGTDPPLFGLRGTRKSRCEFVLDLSGDLAGMLSTNHRRNVRKAQKAGLEVRRTRSSEAAIIHKMLMNESMERRRSRGEKVPPNSPSPEVAAILESGAGELFQATRDGNVLSSLLVLRAEKGSYYQSAGTSPEGMEIGASQFLIHHIAGELKSAGAHKFNLGGADEGSTLGRFKEGFGAGRVHLSSTSCYIATNWRYMVSRAIEVIRSDRNVLWGLLVGGCSRMLVYSADAQPSRMQRSDLAFQFRALTQEDLRTLSAPDPLFRTRQLERLERFGGSYAYGVFVDGRIAHVSWLLPPEAIVKDPPRVVCGQATEAEITGAETLPEFRGRGIYCFAIQNLLDLAGRNGMRRVFMKTKPSNKASMSGMKKAGLKQVGSAIIFTLPLSHRQMIWRRFR